MQQTTKYQLNLIESTDTFSPAPLNENAQKLESAMTAEAQARTQADATEAAARAAGDAALGQRLTAVEVHNVAYGTTSKNTTVSLGFTPVAVLTITSNAIALTGRGVGSAYAAIIEGGFQTKEPMNAGLFQYLALA